MIEMSVDSALPKLGLPEIASLIVLMVEARELTNTELKQISGFALTGPTRRSLNDLKFVESRKVGQVFAHQLTEQGWHACRELLRAERPARAGSAGGALFALLAGVDRALARRRLSPADFFAPQEAPTDPIAPSLPGLAGPAPVDPAPFDATAADGQSAAALDSAIRAAYRGLAKEPADWVGLAALRGELGRFGRAETDEALRRIAMAPDAHLIPVANLKSLTQADRDAAVSLGGEDNHALSIEGR
jgi:hypothetical protein